jgi:signal transduction histidine kinase
LEVTDTNKGRTLDRLILSSRAALVVGFGSLLIIMAAAGLDALRVLQSFRTKEAGIRRAFLFRNHVLNDIRSEVYLSGTYVRDYLLDPESERAEGYRTSLQQVHGQMEAALQSYASQLRPEETQHYAALKDELARYWNALDPIFQWDAAQRQRLGYTFLRDKVFPRRQNMLTIADRIAALNEQQLETANSAVVGLLAAFQTRVALTLAIGLVLGVGMAAFSMRRILNLEHQAHAQYTETAEARSQLKHLSARLVEAQETERRALSRELHDEVGQSLSAVLIELRNLSTMLGALTSEQTRSQVEVIKGLVEASVRVVRNMALLLRPSMLDDLGLVPALRWQAREVSKRTSMDVTVAADNVSDDVPDEYKTCIYRVAQEALNNCARHSEAKVVRVRVLEDGNRLTLSIQDDGKGFDFTESKGMGLLGIHERVASLGGSCQIFSEPGRGTLLKVELIIQKRETNGSASAREENPHPVG